MPRECNIDARGKFLRLVGGSVSLTMAIIAVVLLYLGYGPVLEGVCGACLFCAALHI